MIETSPPDLRLDYELTELDVHHYCTQGWVGKCWRACRARSLAMMTLAMLGLFLVGTCYRSEGARSGTLALGTTMVVLAALAWSSETRAESRVRRIARQMGIPRDLHLQLSPEGIAEHGDDPSRTFAWSEVVDVTRVDHLTVIRLRPAGCLLIIPDRAFPTLDGRDEFAQAIRAWRDADPPVNPPDRPESPA